MRQVKIGDIEIGGKELVVVCGPCVIESEEQTMQAAAFLTNLFASLKIPFVFKSSYDKANRTSAASFRGPGLFAGLKILEKVKNKVQRKM